LSLHVGEVRKLFFVGGKSIYEKYGKKANSERCPHIAPMMSPSCTENYIIFFSGNYIENIKKSKNYLSKKDLIDA